MPNTVASPAVALFSNGTLSYNPETREINGKSITTYINEGFFNVSLEPGSCELTDIRDGKNDSSSLLYKAIELKKGLIEYCYRFIEVHHILAQFLFSFHTPLFIFDKGLIIKSLVECNDLCIKFCKIAFDLDCCDLEYRSSNFISLCFGIVPDKLAINIISLHEYVLISM